MEDRELQKILRDYAELPADDETKQKDLRLFNSREVPPPKKHREFQFNNFKTWIACGAVACVLIICLVVALPILYKEKDVTEQPPAYFDREQIYSYDINSFVNYEEAVRAYTLDILYPKILEQETVQMATDIYLKLDNHSMFGGKIGIGLYDDIFDLIDVVFVNTDKELVNLEMVFKVCNSETDWHNREIFYGVVYNEQTFQYEYYFKFSEGDFNYFITAYFYNEADLSSLGINSIEELPADTLADMIFG